MAAKMERYARTRLNVALSDLCRRPHDGLPISEIADLATRFGFDGTALEGIYTGRDGRSHEKIGERTWLTLTWHKLEVTGRYEIVAYAS